MTFIDQLIGTFETREKPLEGVEIPVDHATPEIWSIERAREYGSLRLVQRVAAREPLPCHEAHYKEFLVSNRLVVAAKNDNLEIDQWLCMQYCPSLIFMKGIKEVDKMDRLHVLEWLFAHFNRKPFWARKIAIFAAGSGHLDLLQWVIPQVDSTALEISLLRSVVHSGHFEMVKWLHERVCARHVPGFLPEDSQSTLIRTICAGHLDTAQLFFNRGYAHESGRQGCPHSAASGGDLDFVKWLDSLRRQSCAVVWINLATAGGYLHLIQLSASNEIGVKCTTKTMNSAATNGHLHVVKWLHEHRSEGCTSAAMDGTAENGHLEIVQWLHEHRSERSVTMVVASSLVS